MQHHRLAAGLCLTVVLLQPSQKPSAQTVGAGPSVTLPTRRDPDPSPRLPPDLPHGSDPISPFTLEVVVRRQPPAGPASTIRQTINRSAGRLHVVDRDREWLFEQNPVDPRRASATLVNHKARALVLYEESDLRNMLGFSGWASVLMLGIDPVLLAELKPSGQTRRLSGLTFAEYSSRRQDGTSADVWWNAAQRLPSHFALRDRAGVVELSISHLRPGVDKTLLESPGRRFPEYRLFDLADWLEQPEK